MKDQYFFNFSRDRGVDIRGTFNTFNGSDGLTNRDSKSDLVDIEVDDITQFALSVVRDTDFTNLD